MLFRARKDLARDHDLYHLVRFNEAVLFRARKGRVKGEIPAKNQSFNEAVLFRARKVRIENEKRAEQLRFNEAVLFRARKALFFLSTHRQGIASMRPCSFEHGKVLGARWHDNVPGRFNEAVLFRARKAMRPFGGNGCVESCFNEAVLFRARKVSIKHRSHFVHTASMRPCSFEHGKSEKNSDGERKSRASMRPCSFEHGKPPSADFALADSDCFNEAVLFRARKAAPFRDGSTCRRFWLQ